MVQEHLLAKSAQRVQAELAKKGLEYKVIELSQGARTAIDAASAIGCNVAQIVKSLIFKTAPGNKPVLILASGPNRVNEKVIATHTGETVIKADADFTHNVTGFAIGGIPPIGHKQTVEFIFIDQELLKFESVWAAAGTPNAVFNLQCKDLLEMTKGKIISVC